MVAPAAPPVRIGMIPLLWMLLVVLPPAAEDRAPVVVSAAISLTGALTEVQRAYTAAGGGPVRFNFAASNVLARQIVNGAPADIFISADEAQMNYAQTAGAIDGSTRRNILSNRLVIMTARPPGPHFSSVEALLDSSIRRIAVGDPSGVPAGVYAKAYLERAGIWTRLQPKLVPLASVRAALSAVDSGAVDAAIVYESDVVAARRARLAFTFDSSAGPPVRYAAAIVTRSRQRRAAERFLAFLQGSEAARIFVMHGFSLPAAVP